MDPQRSMARSWPQNSFSTFDGSPCGYPSTVGRPLTLKLLPISTLLNCHCQVQTCLREAALTFHRPWMGRGVWIIWQSGSGRRRYHRSTGSPKPVHPGGMPASKVPIPGVCGFQVCRADSSWARGGPLVPELPVYPEVVFRVAQAAQPAVSPTASRPGG